MTYTQLTTIERYRISALMSQGSTLSQIAAKLERHRSTIAREIRRNSDSAQAPYDPNRAIDLAKQRRLNASSDRGFLPEQFELVDQLLRKDWSPEQVSGYLNLQGLSISHETIYRHILKDHKLKGDLHTHLRCARKLRRSRYGTYRRRIQPPDRRNISMRPASVEDRRHVGHWEIDTVFGSANTKDCIVSLVERTSRYVLIGKLKNKTPSELNRVTLGLAGPCSEYFTSITADNGTEFAAYKQLEKDLQIKFYFANPYHSWERGTNENMNGLIRQYLPKGKPMTDLTQFQCNAIANTLNERPRKCLGFRTPAQVLHARA